VSSRNDAGRGSASRFCVRLKNAQATSAPGLVQEGVHKAAVQVDGKYDNLLSMAKVFP
jgi:hypothetical protein